VVFALLQLPPLISEGFDRAQPRLDGNWLLVAVFLFLYAKITVLAMIFTFVAHLVIRTLWVAIIGLDSVYPTGIRWEATRYGPVDNFASLVFAANPLPTEPPQDPVSFQPPRSLFAALLLADVPR